MPDIEGDLLDRPTPSAEAIEASKFPGLTISRMVGQPQLQFDWNDDFGRVLVRAHPTWTERDRFCWCYDKYIGRILEAEALAAELSKTKPPETFEEAFAKVDPASSKRCIEWVLENLPHYQDLVKRGELTDARLFLMRSPSGTAVSFMQLADADAKGFFQFASKFLAKDDSDLTEKQKRDDKRKMFALLEAFDS